MHELFRALQVEQMVASLTVLVVETDRTLRQALSSWLVALEGIELAGTAESDAQGIVLARERQPDVVLLDVALATGPEASSAGSLDWRYPGSRILILSASGQDPLVLDALQQGAAGFLVWEDATPASLLEALRTICRGEAVLTPRIAGLILDQISRTEVDGAER
jgi:DNA-binding NarL/FixJ family response regulator